ncbi:UDP-3-O-(3-hydroxymyristoyl)glucosamine N-acyltransferase [Terrihabitans sp. B22-R8]|uniref:UDP-3-O-(3-hydroxymyristoyl)glucosamine N-acyltransferase n=1 Tax=Terrihabitans sp. B22-R8 TaxID=3425128 RepID=UPI00403C2837
MGDPRFFPEPSPISLRVLAELTGAELRGDTDREVSGIGPLERAGPDDLSFLDNKSYASDFRSTRAGACFVSPGFVTDAPAGTALLVSREPYRAFAKAAARLFPSAMRPEPLFAGTGVAPGATVHPSARLESGVTIDFGAVIGPGVEIGEGTSVGANSVIGANVRIGRDCAVAANATLVHTLLGNRVIVHSGARIGQDGFGFAMGPGGHLKIPQIGRVVIQDDVEIGAGTCIDRGGTRDTVVGEGTKIDNLVQIAHNVVIGRHCVIVSQAGISGSTTLGDFVVLGGQAGIVGHIAIGDGTQIGAQAGVMNNVPAGQRLAGAPAQPVRELMREIAIVRKFVRGVKNMGGAKSMNEGSDT